jgi:hypothetical protein
MAFKRNGAVDVTPSKAHKGPDASEDQWACSKCGNMNYASRLVCNMRNCGAQKEQENWVCTGCGNENFGSRIACNMRRCQQIKPGTTMKQLNQVNASAAFASPAMVPKGKGGVGKGFGKGFVTSGDPRAHEAGAWTCSCGNLNFSGRTECNARGCRKQRPAHVMQQQWNQGYAAQLLGQWQPVYAAKPPQQAPAPEGSWQCTACKNVNFPNRDTCNAKSCGQPRNLVDGGAPMSARNQQAAAPAGSWTCSSCNNVNFPNRTVCNRRDCSTPKDA